MKTKRTLYLLVLAVAAILLSACGVRPAASWPGLSADGETAYVAFGQFVYAVRIEDGSMLWRYPTEADGEIQFIAAPLLVGEDTLIVGSSGSDHSLIALDLTDIASETGSPRAKWTFSAVKDRWAAPALALGGKLYAANTDGTLYVIDLGSGAAVNEIAVDGPFWAPPITDGRLIYLASLDHHLYAIDTQTNSVVWKSDLGGAIPGAPALGQDGRLYVGTFGSRLLAIDSQTGASSPVTTAQDWIWGSPLIEGETIFFADLSGRFYAFDLSGDQKWPPVQPDGPVVGSPLLMPEYIVIATESGTVYAIDRSGEIVWEEHVGGKIYTAPIVAGERILVAPLGVDFMLAALNQNGQQVWTFAPED